MGANTMVRAPKVMPNSPPQGRRESAMAHPRNDRTGSKEKGSPVTGDLGQRIARAQESYRSVGERAKAQTTGRDMTGMGRAMRLGSEFIAAILVGAGIGYLLDQWLKTGPWLMLVLLLVGFAAGVLNVVRAAGEMNQANPPPKGSDLGPDADDDDT